MVINHIPYVIETQASASAKNGPINNLWVFFIENRSWKIGKWKRNLMEMHWKSSEMKWKIRKRQKKILSSMIIMSKKGRA